MPWLCSHVSLSSPTTTRPRREAGRPLSGENLSRSALVGVKDRPLSLRELRNRRAVGLPPIPPVCFQAQLSGFGRVPTSSVWWNKHPLIGGNAFQESWQEFERNSIDSK